MQVLARLFSILALATAIGASVYLWTGPTYRGVTATAVAPGESAVQVERTVSAREMGQTPMLYWPLGLVAATALGAGMIWRGSAAGAATVTGVLFLAGVAGLMSIGMYILAVALLLGIASGLALAAKART